ncbi:MAG TPA: hypothetical protein VEI02_06810 [Planctomycetota bacterium]|nr:hypothetical protein [Planctomycetota bacterium]
MEAIAQPMTAPAKAMEVYDRYLAEEAALRLPEVDLHDRARFHRCVRQCALAWSRHPKAGFRILRARHTLALAFEGPVDQKTVVLFTFRSACEYGDYRFQGFSLSSLPQGLGAAPRTNLQRLRELYEAALPQSFSNDGAVTVLVRKNPTIDFLPIVDEARRVLDDGNQEFPPVDLRELMVVPAENARLFIGKTNVVPVIRPKVEAPPPIPRPAPAPPPKPAARTVPTPPKAPPHEKNGAAKPAPPKSNAAQKVPPAKSPVSSKAAPAGKTPAAPAKGASKTVEVRSKAVAKTAAAPRVAAKPAAAKKAPAPASKKAAATKPARKR